MIPLPDLSLADIAQRLDQLFARWNRSDAPGLVIGVALRGRCIYRRGFGLASVEHGTANTPATRMRIASTSKHFTALAVLLLAEEGKLDIDVPARTYLPELVGMAGTPTLRQFMRHTSGVRDPRDLPSLLLCSGVPVLLPEGLALELSQRFSSANHAPGERMIYNNHGYHLLSLVVERVSGLHLGEFLKQRILDPLGMNDTGLLPSDMEMAAGVASFHLLQPDGSYRRGIYPSEELLGSGGMISTIDDMLIWLSHLRGVKKVGGQQAWQQLLEQPRYNGGMLGSYCLGLKRERYRGAEIVHHSGATWGSACQMLTVPEHGLDISVMFNRMDGNAPGLALKVIDVVLGDTVLAPAPAPLLPQAYSALLGRWYAQKSRRVFSVVSHSAPEQEPLLALAIHEQTAGLLREIDGGLLMTSTGHGEVELRLPDGGSRPETLEFVDSGNAELFRRLPDAGPAVAELAPELVGRYRYSDFDLELSVVLQGGKLYLDLLPRYGSERFELEPFSRDVLGCQLSSSLPIHLPWPATLVVERRNKEVAGLWLSNLRTRNLWLERCTRDDTRV